MQVGSFDILWQGGVRGSLWRSITRLPPLVVQQRWVVDRQVGRQRIHLVFYDLHVGHQLALMTCTVCQQLFWRSPLLASIMPALNDISSALPVQMVTHRQSTLSLG